DAGHSLRQRRSVVRLQHHHLARQSWLDGARREHVARARIPSRLAGRLSDGSPGPGRLLHLHPPAIAGRDRHVRLRLAAGAAAYRLAGLRLARDGARYPAAPRARSVQGMSAICEPNNARAPQGDGTQLIVRTAYLQSNEKAGMSMSKCSPASVTMP